MIFYRPHVTMPLWQELPNFIHKLRDLFFLLEDWYIIPWISRITEVVRTSILSHDIGLNACTLILFNPWPPYVNIKEQSLQNTPTPWLTLICFVGISLT